MYSNISYIRDKLNILDEYFKNLNLQSINKSLNDILLMPPQNKFTNNKYRSIIEKIVTASNLPNKELLLDLFGNPTILSISSYRKFLDYKALDEWDNYRNKNYNIYNNLFLRLNDSLKKYGLEKTLTEYDNCIKLIEDNTDKSYQQIVLLISEYYQFLKMQDPVGLSNASSNLKSLIRVFNRNSKIKFINNYTNQNVTKIKDLFKVNINLNYNNWEKIDLEQFFNIIISNDELRNIIKIFILEKFNYTAFNDSLFTIIKNILDDNDQKNLDLFNIEQNTLLFLLNINKAYNRIKRNYLPALNKNFDISQIELINSYLKEEDIKKRNTMKKSFTQQQLLILENLIPIVKEATATFIDKNNQFDVTIKNRVLSNDERKELVKNKKQLDSYNKLKKLILKFYYLQCATVKNIINENKVMLNINNITFTDDNYSLMNNDYIFNFNLIARIIFNIDKDSWNQYANNETIYKHLKKLLIKDGLLACVLQDNENETLITDIINNLPSTIKSIPNLEININNLSDIVSKTKLSIIIDEDTIDILGFEVAKKIAFDTQFLQGKNTNEKIIKRLNIANELMIMASYVDKSAIPYFEPITIENITVSRYKNNDPNILTSGIDSNTCFKISANDNDYLFYSILNKNGMVAKFTINDKMIGRITAHRLNNVLLINGIRTIENDYQATSLTKLKRNNIIVNLVVELAKELIKETENSDCPIDFVVSNKAGILESSDYDNKFELLPTYLFTNPIDCYNEDFKEFKDLYSEYLQETPYYSGGSQAPFTTDFGHYPIILIASRDNKHLERKMDISFNSPEAIYPRPKEHINKLKIKSI